MYSIVIPLFNEEESIGPLVRNIISTVGDDPGFMEVILVDDGSTDETALLAAAFAEGDSRIILVKHRSNKGLGAAIRTGLAASKGDFVLYTDADLPFDFSLIPTLIAEADSNSVLTGFRLNRGEGVRRWVLTKGYNFLIWLLFGLNLNDVNFACKIMPKRFVSAAELNSDGSFIDVEILMETRRLGLATHEYPLIYYPRQLGTSTLSRPGIIVVILSEMFSFIKTRLANQHGILTFVRCSPAVKLAILFAILTTSAVFVLQPIQVNHEAALATLLAETSAATFFLGWRFGLLAAGATVIGSELSRIWQIQQILRDDNFRFFGWALLAVVFSHVCVTIWQFLQRAQRLNTSE